MAISALTLDLIKRKRSNNTIEGGGDQGGNRHNDVNSANDAGGVNGA
jgi:hypothetical protein